MFPWRPLTYSDEIQEKFVAENKVCVPLPAISRTLTRGDIRGPKEITILYTTVDNNGEGYA
jgi:hypothetical protein